MEVRRVHAEVDLHVSVLLVRAIFEFFSEGVERNRLRTHHPSFVEVALLLRYPDVPQRLELISVILVQEVARALDGLFRTRTEVITLFKDARLAARNWMDGKI